MKKFWKALLVIIIVVVAAFLCLRLINTCDSCEKTFFGLGYQGNAIDMISEEEEQILCEDCAKKHHALSLLTGKELDAYKRVLVPGKLIPGEVRFGSETDS